MQREAPDKSLARLLFAAIATPLLLLLGVGLVLVFLIKSLTDALWWVNHTNRVVNHLYSIENQVAEQESSLRGYLLARDRDLLGAFERARPMRSLGELRDQVSDNPLQVDRIDELRQRYDLWFELATEAAGQPPADALRNAAEVHARKQRMDPVREVLAEMVSAESALMASRVRAAEDVRRLTLFAAVVLFLVTGGALAFGSRRQLRRVADSYRGLLDSERTARTEVEAQNWIRNSQVQVAAAVQGDQRLEQLARRALEALALSLDAVVATFYVNEPGGWRRRAAYALDGETPEWFANGEGLVGQCAIGRKLVHLREVPVDFLKVRAGLGEHAPAAVVLLPACVDEVPVAVLEFGFLHPVEPRALELLERVGEIIGAAVRSVEHKLRLADLLEEAQRTGEELQTQQEELKVANEELQQRGDALQLAHAQLEERKEELEVSNSSLAAQRDALEAAQRALVEKAAEVERASRYKSEFLANMSHELRTPLNSSLILAKLLADNKHGNLAPEQVAFANTIYSAGNDLLAIINDVLDLSKIEAGKIELHPAAVSLGALIGPIARMFEPVAQQKQVGFGVVIDDEAASFETDAQRVQQVLNNLLSNAFKFTEQGQVTLRVERVGDQVEFAVCDTGIGIPVHQHEVIFEAFCQADGTTNRRFGGTGLGLSISRDLARLLGGELRLTSEVGKGSCFVLALPQRYVGRPQPAPRAAPALVSRAPASRRPPSYPALRRVEPVLPDDRGQIDASRRMLLIVEDDISFAKILADLARELEFQFILAHTADDGVRLAVEFVPSAIVLDMKLPDHSGLSVLDRLKRNPRTRHIPVHIMSVEDHSRAALSMGAVGYLRKPAERSELAQVLTDLKQRFVRVRRLLVIEDDSDQRDAITRLLMNEGVEIVAVATVADALAQLRAATFDCVVTDLVLPDGTGFDLLSRMASDEGYAFPPVIVYTGRSLTVEEESELRRYSTSIIIKGARSPERLLDEVTLFLHQVEAELPVERQRMLRQARDREAVFDGRKILLAEDDVRNIFALSSVLEPKGAQLIIARNGREAVEAIERDNTIDLVLMDVMMPEMDGLQAMREIRSRGGRFGKLPIIAITAKAMQDDQQRCLEAGANDYIPKPLDVEVLLSLTRVWMPK